MKSGNQNTVPKVKNRVLIAMSGGVDSSAAAALLVEQGYEVIGATMQVWDYTQCEIDEGNGTCCSSLDVDDARAVADKLEIPFYVLNCESKFKTAVIDPFIQSYMTGYTPLPCINCNTFLKFDHLVQKMKELECDYLATGHYAQVLTDAAGKKHIVTSEDDWKDQTYFLFTMNPEIIPHLLFPIGHMKKPQVREYAEKQGLVNARKKDSTGICFVGNQGYANFIESQVDKSKLKKGWIKRYPSGEQMAEHPGIHHFTYGQSRGLGMTHHEKLFVLKTDPETATVWVGDEKYLFSGSAVTEDAHFINDFEEGELLQVKVRYAHKGSPAKVYREGRGLRIEFLDPQRAITPGQAAVLYRDRTLIGGGWIR
ncbi:MAG: tRNA 2-thiouridine(34) synthase MnmA [Pseudobdellovibrionaceae bacterium]